MRARLVAAGLLALAAPAAAREAVYSVDDAVFRRDALALEVDAPFRPMPVRGAADFVLEGGAKLDNELMILGIFCRAWKVENPLSQIVARALTAPIGTEGSPALPRVRAFRSAPRARAPPCGASSRRS